MAKLGFTDQLYHVRDEKANGADGGSFTSGAWRTRVLNTALTSEITGASLAANQVTLPAGTYYIDVKCPAFNVEDHKSMLYNITDTAVELTGTSERSAGGSVTRSIISGRFTIAVEKVFEVQHICYASKLVTGFGYGSAGLGSANEVYTDVKIWKVA